jgi:hypothetical protein
MSLDGMSYLPFGAGQVVCHSLPPAVRDHEAYPFRWAARRGQNIDGPAAKFVQTAGLITARASLHWLMSVSPRTASAKTLAAYRDISMLFIEGLSREATVRRSLLD